MNEDGLRNSAQDMIMAQLEIGNDEQWQDELYASYIKRTGIAPEHAVLVVHSDGRGEKTFSYRWVLGFEPDGTPIIAQRYPLPLLLWESAVRLTERRPWVRALALAGVPVVTAATAWALGKWSSGGRT